MANHAPRVGSAKHRCTSAACNARDEGKLRGCCGCPVALRRHGPHGRVDGQGEQRQLEAPIGARSGSAAEYAESSAGCEAGGATLARQCPSDRLKMVDAAAAAAADSNANWRQEPEGGEAAAADADADAAGGNPHGHYPCTLLASCLPDAPALRILAHAHAPLVSHSLMDSAGGW